MLKFINEKPLWFVLILGLALRLVAAFFSHGYYAFDDYYQLVDVSWGWTEGINQSNWFVEDYSDNTELRNVIYPGIVYLLLLFAKIIGITEPFYQMVLVQVVHAFYSLLIVFFAYRITLAISNKKSALVVGLLTAGLWFFPFMSVRTLIEWTSIPVILFAVDRYYCVNSRGVKEFVLIGMALALGFAIRYQVSFFTLGFGIGILIKDRWKPFFIMSLSFVLTTVLIQGVGDYFVCGMPFGKLIEYVNYNLAHGSSYISRPVYDYILLIPALLIPPIGLMMFYFVFRKGYKQLPLFLSIVSFLVFHSVYENKQERFMFTIIPMVVILGTPYLLQQMDRTWWSKWKKNLVWGMFLFVNSYLLVLMTVNYTKKSKIEAMRYLRAQDEVSEIYIVNTDKFGTGIPVNLTPQFYYGERFTPRNIDTQEAWDLVVSDSVKVDSYILFEVLPDKEFSEEKLIDAEKHFGKLEYMTRIHGSLIDNFRYKLNPIVKNDEYVIYRKK